MRKQQDVHDLAAMSRILAFAVLEALLVLSGAHDGLGDGNRTDLSKSASSSATGFGLGVIDVGLMPNTLHARHEPAKPPPGN